jgi:hypothetical protein
MDTDIKDEIEKFISTAWDQITNESSDQLSTQDSDGIYFTQQFHHTAKNHGLSESDALDVYHNGEPVDEGKIVRGYAAYEIGITYFLDSQNGRIVITSIWKQEIR